MLLVRKTLTSIMLEVTNEIIQEISNETLTKYRKKGRNQEVLFLKIYFFLIEKCEVFIQKNKKKLIK